MSYDQTIYWDSVRISPTVIFWGWEDPNEPILSVDNIEGIPGVDYQFSRLMNFDAGETEIEVGDTITGVGGGSAYVADITVISGSWGGNDAAGILYLTGQIGVFIDNADLEKESAIVRQFAVDNLDWKKSNF